jgi:mycoredoxin
MSEQLAASGPPVRVYATSWCPDCALARRVLDGFAVDYDWIDITGDQQAIDYVTSVNGGNRSVPTIVFPEGDILTEPSRQTLVTTLARLGYAPKP